MHFIDSERHIHPRTRADCLSRFLRYRHTQTPETNPTTPITPNTIPSTISADIDDAESEELFEPSDPELGSVLLVDTPVKVGSILLEPLVAVDVARDPVVASADELTAPPDSLDSKPGGIRRTLPMELIIASVDKDAQPGMV